MRRMRSMRLIDADALKKHYAWWADDRQILFDSIVDSQPTVDAVPVIRCKDCRFFKEQYLSIAGNNVPAHWCEEWFGNTRESGFCYLAERRTDDLEADKRI